MDHVHRKVKLTPVSVLHYVRLAYRSLLFLGLFALYLSYRLRGGEDVLTAMEKRPMILVLIWAVFTTEMILRFFPSGLESPGCQKQFARNYIKTGKTHIEMHENNATVLVALIWIFFNGVFGALHMLEILDDGIMILLSCAYSICDMICILFWR